jgi:CRP/FNR family cyclic AMP-dependent transcriptional regulator
MLGSEKRAMARQLSTYPAFAGCTEDDLVALAQAGARFSVPPGWALVQEGIPSDACYVIMEGTANVYRERAEIATLGPGDVVGEMTLFAGGQRRATVTSVTHVSGLRIENGALGALVIKRPRLRAALTAVYHAHQSDQA